MRAIDVVWSPRFGIRVFPYQMGFGISISWWPIFRLQLYIGPIRTWFSIGSNNV